MRPYANLHTHSTHSDGVYSPEELVLAAKVEGYKALAVTDHDTATAGPLVKKFCEREGLNFIFGTEFSAPPCNEFDACFHITAFDYDPAFPAMADYLDQMGHRETDQTKAVFDMETKSGDITGITWDEVLEYNNGIKWLCNNHVYRAMIAKGIADEKDYIAWFNKNWLVQRGYFPPSIPFKSTRELIKLIGDAGGIAVLAHPHNQLKYVDALVNIGLRGIEVYHPDLTPDEQKRSMAIAYAKGLFISGGTDHDGLCGGIYKSLKNIKESVYYHEPLSFGVMEQHFFELKNHSLSGRVPLPEEYTAIGRKYD